LSFGTDQARPEQIEPRLSVALSFDQLEASDTSLAFGKRCSEAGIRPSMGSVGEAYDNAMADSFFSTFEAELLSRRRFALRPRLSWRASATSKAGTTRCGSIRDWATARP